MTDRDNQEFYDDFHANPDKARIEVLKQSERKRLLKKLLGHQTGSTLVIGCGRGEEIDIVLEAGPSSVCAIDYSEEAIRLAGRRHKSVKFQQGDAHNLAFNDRQFDCVVCSEVIEHLERPEVAVSEISRVLKSNGTAVLTVPNQRCLFGAARFLAEAVTGKPVHAANQPLDYWYTPGEFRKLISRDFEVDASRGSWYFPPTGKGKKRLPDLPMFCLFRPFIFIDRMAGRFTPGWGHIYGVVARKK